MGKQLAVIHPEAQNLLQKGHQNYLMAWESLSEHNLVRAQKYFMAAKEYYNVIVKNLPDALLSVITTRLEVCEKATLLLNNYTGSVW